MILPIYNITKITFADASAINKILDGISFGQCPIALDLSNSEKPQECLDHIENYIDIENIRLTPYPIIIISRRK